jgi:hypothetical protein
LEDLDAEVEINSAWETIRENSKISTKESLGGHYELKKHKTGVAVKLHNEELCNL